MHRVGVKATVAEVCPAITTVEGPDEWVGTQVSWDLARVGEWAIINFKHEGRREPVEFMSYCTTKWAIYLMSLKTWSKPAEVPLPQ